MVDKHISSCPNLILGPLLNISCFLQQQQQQQQHWALYHQGLKVFHQHYHSAVTYPRENPLEGCSLISAIDKLPHRYLIY